MTTVVLSVGSYADNAGSVRAEEGTGNTADLLGIWRLAEARLNAQRFLPEPELDLELLAEGYRLMAHEDRELAESDVVAGAETLPPYDES